MVTSTPGPVVGAGLTEAFMARALQEFALEAQSLGEEVESAVLALERSPHDAASVHTLFRCFHTIKGSAGLFGFDGLENFCHRLETALEPMRTGNQILDRSMGTVLLRCNDHIKRLIDLLCQGQALTPALIAAGDTLLDGLMPSAKAQPVPALVRTDTAPPVHQTEAVVAGQPTPLRVDPTRLDDIIALLGELAIAQSSANLQARRLQDAALTQCHERMEELTHAIRHKSMSLRMVPLGETLSRFHRIVRDLASTLGKELELEIVGGDTELDKSLVDKIVDPLMHLIRNASDHGIELPAERVAAGKDPLGRLVLEARHDAGHVTLTLRDDGRGIDRERVLARALSSGLIAAHRDYSDQDVLNLVFAPGFSTAQSVTTVSGRGVGMDVVKSSIEALRGTVRIESELGQGTCVTLSLPLTLASFEGFLVQVAHTHCIVPLAQVQEVVDWSAASAQQGTMELRGKVVPVLQLGTLYGLEEDVVARRSVLVVTHQDDVFGITVDALVGPQQTVLKPLGPLFRKLPGVAGSSLLGDGTVALVLDLASLAQRARQLL